MTSDRPERAYVWAWLPSCVEPVPAGVIEGAAGGVFTFAYGRSFLARSRADAPALWGPELPTRPGRQPPPGLSIAGVIRDAMPDAEWHAAADTAQLTAAERTALWGRQVCNPFAFEGYGTAPGQPAQL